MLVSEVKTKEELRRYHRLGHLEHLVFAENFKLSLPKRSAIRQAIRINRSAANASAHSVWSSPYMQTLEKNAKRRTKGERRERLREGEERETKRKECSANPSVSSKDKRISFTNDFFHLTRKHVHHVRFEVSPLIQWQNEKRLMSKQSCVCA